MSRRLPVLPLPGRRRCGSPGLSEVAWLLVPLLQGCSGVGRSALVGRRLLRRTLRLLQGWAPRSVDQAPAVVVKAPVAGSPVAAAGDCRERRLVAVPVVVVLLVSVSPTAAEPVPRAVLVVRCRVRVAWPRLPVNRLAVPVLVVAPVVSVVLCPRLRVEMPLVSAFPGQAVVTVVLPPARRPVGVSPVRSGAQQVEALEVVLFRVLWVGPRPGRRRLGDPQLQAVLLGLARPAGLVRLVQGLVGHGRSRVPITPGQVVPARAGRQDGLRYVDRVCRHGHRGLVGRCLLAVEVPVVEVGRARGQRRFSTTAPGFLTRRVEFPGRGVR